MQAHLRRHGDVMVISISGALSIEETQPFREACLREFLGKKIVFNMAGANFVGSTGIQAFLETLRAMGEAEHGVHVVGVKSEFRRIISSLEAQKIEIFEDETTAVKEWLRPSVPDSIVD